MPAAPALCWPKYYRIVEQLSILMKVITRPFQIMRMKFLKPL